MSKRQPPRIGLTLRCYAAFFAKTEKRPKAKKGRNFDGAATPLSVTVTEIRAKFQAKAN